MVLEQKISNNTMSSEVVDTTIKVYSYMYLKDSLSVTKLYVLYRDRDTIHQKTICHKISYR